MAKEEVASRVDQSIDDLATDQIGSVSRVNLEIILTRIAATQEAQKRSRLAFLACTGLSIIIMIGAWNAYFSWHRFLLLAPSPISKNNVNDLGELLGAIPEEVAKAAEKDMPNPDVTYFARQQVIAEWASSQIISLPLIGIRIAVSDAAVVGSASLLFIVTMFTLSMRRENRTIGKLLRATSRSREELLDLVFHGVTSNMLFTDLGESEAPIDSLDSRRLGKAPAMKLRNVFKVLMFLPAIAVAVVIFCDIYSIVGLQAALRYTHDPLFYVIGNDIETWTLVGIYELIAVSFLFLIITMCKKALAFEQGTGAVLREYGAKISEQLSVNGNSEAGLVA